MHAGICAMPRVVKLGNEVAAYKTELGGLESKHKLVFHSSTARLAVRQIAISWQY